MISTERLHASFQPNIASLKVIAGVDHNTISTTPQYLLALQGAL